MGLGGPMSPLRLGALVSGGGRTLLNLADRIDDGSLAASVDLVIASRPDRPEPPRRLRGEVARRFETPRRGHRGDFDQLV